MGALRSIKGVELLIPSSTATMHCAHAFAPSTPDNVSADEEEEPLLRKESSSSSSGACEALIADSSVLQSTILERAGSSPLASYLVRLTSEANRICRILLASDDKLR